MNPDEREMLEKTLRLSRENHELLLKIQARAKRAAIWGFIKLLIVVIPIVLGFLYLEPRIAPLIENFNEIREAVASYSSVLSR